MLHSFHYKKKKKKKKMNEKTRYLNGNQLSGAIPNEFGNLNNLTEL